MDFTKDSVPHNGLKISDSDMGSNEFINNLNYIQCIRSCKKKIKRRLQKMGNSRKHCLNRHEDFRGYIFDKFIIPVKKKVDCLEVNAYLVLINDREYYKTIRCMDLPNKKSIRKNHRLR